MTRDERERRTSISYTYNLSSWTLANVIIWRVCGMPMFIVREVFKHRLDVASKEPYIFLENQKYV